MADPISPQMQTQLAGIPTNAEAPQQAAPVEDPHGFLNALREVPMLASVEHAKQIKALTQAPATETWFAQHMPNATASQRAALIERQAKQNADVFTVNTVAAAKQKYGVAQLTPSVLKQKLEAFHGDDKFAPSKELQQYAAAQGRDAIKDFKDEAGGKAQGEFNALKNYLPLDPEQATPPPVVQKPQPVPMQAPAMPPLVSPGVRQRLQAAAPPQDPALAKIYNYMAGAQKQAAAQQATGTVQPGPVPSVPPQAAAPAAPPQGDV